MMRIKRYMLCVAMVFMTTEVLLAQKSKEENWALKIEQARQFVWDSLSQKVYNMAVEPKWFADHSGFAYQTQTREGRRYYVVSFSDLKKKEAFEIDILAKKLRKITGKEVHTRSLNLQNQKWQNDREFSFQWEGATFNYNISDSDLVEKEKAEKKDKSISKSPDGKSSVFIKDYNLFYVFSGDTVALSTDGKKDYVYGSSYGWDQIMVGENAIPKPRLNVNWSPDGKKLLTQIMDTRDAERMYMLNWSIDSLYRPQLLSYFRGSPGDTSVVHYIPLIYDLDIKKATRLDLDPIPHFMDDLAGYGLKWSEDGSYLYGTRNHRGYKRKDIITVDPKTGRVKVIYKDSSKTNIDYLTRFKKVPDLDIAFITSEKTGWKQLYKVNLKTGTTKPVTSGDFVVKDIEAIDADRKVLYFTAAGKEQGMHPYFDLLYRVNFDGSDLQLLTLEPAQHKVYISDDFEYFIDNRSTAQVPTLSELRRTDNGMPITIVDQADIDDLKAMGWEPPQEFEAMATDGKTKIYGALWKPTHFDKSKSYPIVDFTYTGPHMNVFPNDFRKGVYGLYNSPQALAELGFVVMQVDGRGSAGRSKVFHDKSYQNLGANLEDHVAAIHYLSGKYSWIDAERVGIFGHSFGGYDAAHALLAYNDTYKVAVSESGDHDWRMEKAWYPEMYAGWPVNEVYENQSNVTMASQLKGKLLLIHGGIDENVNPSATFKLSEALIKAGRYFDMLIIPSSRHAIPKEYYPYVQEKRWQFFIDHLIVNPPK